jgi:hypothetical protein
MRRSAPPVRSALAAASALALLAASSPLAPAALAQDAASASAPYAAETIKAAYLANFVRFTDWPPGIPGTDQPFVVGVSGNRLLEDELIRLADRQLIRGHRLRIVRLRVPRDLEGIHVAFFDAAAESQLENLSSREALPLLGERPVLTVSDAPSFLERGGIVSLYREDSALRFAIAPEAARLSGLSISSRLLALARIHRTPPEQP